MSNANSTEIIMFGIIAIVILTGFFVIVTQPTTIEINADINNGILVNILNEQEWFDEINANEITNINETTNIHVTYSGPTYYIKSAFND